LAGLDAADRAGLEVKINTVALKGVNQAEAPELVAWAHGRGYDLTFIEVMPLGGAERERLDQHVPLTQVRASLAERFTLTPSTHRSEGPARFCLVEETGGRVGFITPLTHSFCEACNRVRVTCSGKLHLCLGHEDGVDLREPLRLSPSDDLLIGAVQGAISRKPKGHDFVASRRVGLSSNRRAMSVTGG